MQNTPDWMSQRERKKTNKHSNNSLEHTNMLLESCNYKIRSAITDHQSKTSIWKNNVYPHTWTPILWTKISLLQNRGHKHKPLWTNSIELPHWTYKSSVIASRDRVMQIMIFHHSHLSPYRMYRMGLRSTPECFRGCGAEDTFLHCFWSCPFVSSFWSEIGSFFSTVLGVSNILHPKNCLLDVFGVLSVSVYIKRLLRILYFFAKKTILLRWKGTSQPTVTTWLQLIINSLPLYKLTFNLRKGPLLFHKLWNSWLSSPLTLVSLGLGDCSAPAEF